MRQFRSVAIIGVGLVGGSLALALKKKKLVGEIIGVGRRRKNLSLAKKLGIIDRGSLDAQILESADLVILATPVETVIKIAKRISPVLKKNCIVTDVGSTKEKIVQELDKLFPNFLGAHPLAGSEKRGLKFAKADIFEGSLCILTPTGKTKPRALREIKILWERLGARTVSLSPCAHDRITAFVSHLPHIAVFSLINSIPKKYLKFAASGLKDTTRIAASDEQLWADIFLSNENSLKVIDLFQDNLTGIKRAIKNRDRKSLVRILKNAKIKRESLG